MTRLPEREANSKPALFLDTCQPTRTGSAPTSRRPRTIDVTVAMTSPGGPSINFAKLPDLLRVRDELECALFQSRRHGSVNTCPRAGENRAGTPASVLSFAASARVALFSSPSGLA